MLNQDTQDCSCFFGGHSLESSLLFKVPFWVPFSLPFPAGKRKRPPKPRKRPPKPRKRRTGNGNAPQNHGNAPRKRPGNGNAPQNHPALTKRGREGGPRRPAAAAASCLPVLTQRKKEGNALPNKAVGNLHCSTPACLARQKTDLVFLAACVSN